MWRCGWVLLIAAVLSAVTLAEGARVVESRTVTERHPLAQRPGRDWPMAGGNPQRTWATDEAIQPPLRVAWVATPDVSGYGGEKPGIASQTAGYQYRGNIHDPIVYGGVVYCMAVTRLMALDGWTGRVLWTAPTDETLPNAGYTVPCAGQGVVCCAVGSAVYGFDAQTGKRLWKRELPLLHGVTPDSLPPTMLLDSGFVLVASADTPRDGWVLRALAVRDGREAWRFPAEGGLGTYGPCGDGVLFSTTTGANRRVIAVSTRSGRALWELAFDTASLPTSTEFLALDRRKHRLYGCAMEHGYGADETAEWLIAFDLEARRCLWRKPSVERGQLWPNPPPGSLRFPFGAHTVAIALGREGIALATTVTPDYRQGLEDFTCTSGFSPQSGRLLWQVAGQGVPGGLLVGAGSGTQGSIITCGDLLYAFAVGKILVQRSQTGDVIWDSSQGRDRLSLDAFTGLSRAAVSHGRVFISNGRDLVAMDGAR